MPTTIPDPPAPDGEPDHEIVGRILDQAAHADREALFAALQAALAIGLRLPYRTLREDYLHVEHRLNIGHPYGGDHR